jgi:hypothetical protein
MSQDSEVFCNDCLMPIKEMGEGKHTSCAACGGQLILREGDDFFAAGEGAPYDIFLKDPVNGFIAQMLTPGPRTIETTARVIDRAEIP